MKNKAHSLGNKASIIYARARKNVARENLFNAIVSLTLQIAECASREKSSKSYSITIEYER